MAQIEDPDAFQCRLHCVPNDVATVPIFSQVPGPGGLRFRNISSWNQAGVLTWMRWALSWGMLMACGRSDEFARLVSLLSLSEPWDAIFPWKLGKSEDIDRLPGAVKILLVDDHPLLRGGMRYLLRSLDADLQMDEASNAGQALELVVAGNYDLVLLDLRMPGLNGLEALAALRAVVPGTPLVVLSAEDDPDVVRASIEGGAMGYIPKSSTPEVLIQALRLVLAEGVYLPPAVLQSARLASASLRESCDCGTDAGMLPGLTRRQMDVLRCVIKGEPNKTIARELEVSEGTVKAHLSAVFHALGARNRTEAVYAAAKLGLRLA